MLTRLREWIRSLRRGWNSSQPEPETAEEQRESQPQLDPENVTETRARSDDDAVEKLRDLQRAREEEGESGGDDRDRGRDG